MSAFMDYPPSAAGLGFVIMTVLILAVIATTGIWVRGGRANNTYRTIIIGSTIAAVILAMVCIELVMTQNSYNVWDQATSRPRMAYASLVGMGLVCGIALCGFIALMIRRSWTWAAAAACLVFALATVYSDVFAYRRYSLHWSQLTATFWILTVLSFVAFLVTAAYQTQPGSIRFRRRRQAPILRPASKRDTADSRL
jgi:hypothetical protein